MGNSSSSAVRSVPQVTPQYCDVSPKVTSSRHPSGIYAHQMFDFRPDWHHVAQLATQSVGSIVLQGGHIGFGILVGIDRFLAPAHLVNGTCPCDFEVSFMIEEGNHCLLQSFSVIQILEVNREIDFCILQVSRAETGCYRECFPGERLPIPRISCSRHAEEFLLVHADEHGDQVMSIGAPCERYTWTEFFCSYIDTVPGSSGGAHFNAAGEIFAMYLARSTGRCGGSDRERKAVFLQDIVDCSQILSLPKCRPICPPSVPRCVDTRISRGVCFVDEGKTALSGDYRGYLYWEDFLGNPNGPGPRGIRIITADKKIDVRYRFGQNPHSTKGYNKRQGELYRAATKRFYGYYEARGAVPSSFEFDVYGATFTASFQGA